MTVKKIAMVLILALSFLNVANAQEWQKDLKKAEKIASTEDKPIVLVFQGSDWCAPCIKLDKEIWSTDAFKNYAKEHFVMLKADFPRRSKNKLAAEQQEKNNKLAETYNPEGYFPLVVVLDKSGTVLGKTGYKKTTPEEYIKTLNSFQK
ncbi:MULTISPECIES: thioredoxin family protein [Flavobacteriaceae]|uniref:Thioredoxin-related protein n=2 Tax=Flavobacteriaceae TaxID=49546 RepID=A0A1K1RZ62_9FLAO|nr:MULTISPECIES: thioredoxin family protein [Flavobacteriaceae]MDG3581401.1 thioredoxin family protein [Galbibacter pacificus]MDG3584879.1 thioredoxin family protein [Galbibacter pacificus]SFW77092.1 Thioredoxin-related protein [Sinomicrobium oceani]|tara:strand:+ start:315 stop:761 length:447 start_codon:yes stop_codon:yes gene_type:complete